MNKILQHTGFISGIWEDWANYDSKNKGNWWDKTGWIIHMSEQRDVTFLYLYKRYYNYSENDIELNL